MASFVRVAVSLAVAVMCVVAARSTQAASWYYCNNPPGYYPYVSACNGPWRQVPTAPPAGSRPVAPKAMQGDDSPSFDCAAARQADEKLICSDRDLSHADHEMAAAYRQYLDAAGPAARQQITEDQRKWISQRRANCSGFLDQTVVPGAPAPRFTPEAMAARKIECLKRQEANRTQQLLQRIGALKQPPAANTPALASRDTNETCDSWIKNKAMPVAALKPIDCVSPADPTPGTKSASAIISELGFHVSSITLSSARPEVRAFIATVNDRLAQAKAGRRLSDKELEKDRTMGKDTRQVAISIGYPRKMIFQPYQDNEQWIIDDAFVAKALGYIAAIDAKEISTRAQEQQAAAAAERAKQQHEAEIQQHEAEIKSAEKEQRRAVLNAHQWRSDKKDPAAIFSFLGVTFGDSTPLEAWNFSGRVLRSINGHPEITLYVGMPENNPFGPIVWVTRKNDKNIGLIYTFPFTQSQTVAKRLIETYGNPNSTMPVEWQNTFGAVITGTELRWKTPAGIMQFDDRSEQLDKGRVAINPDAALDAKAIVQGLPPDKF